MKRTQSEMAQERSIRGQALGAQIANRRGQSGSRRPRGLTLESVAMLDVQLGGQDKAAGDPPGHAQTTTMLVRLLEARRGVPLPHIEEQGF